MDFKSLRGFIILFAVGLLAVCFLQLIHIQLLPYGRGFAWQIGGLSLKLGLLVDTFFYATILFILLLSLRVLVDPKMAWMRRRLLYPFRPLGEIFNETKPFKWLELIGGPALISAVVGLISFFVTQSQNDLTKQLTDAEQKRTIAYDYIQEMTHLIDNNESEEDWTDSLKIAVSTRTLNTLEALEEGDFTPIDTSARTLQGYILRFALRTFPYFPCSDRQLREGDFSKCPIPKNISLKGILLTGFEIEQLNKQIPIQLFKEVDLMFANLDNSKLDAADLDTTQFQHASLRNVSFSKNTRLWKTNFKNADLADAKFRDATIIDVEGLHKATLSKTEFIFDFSDFEVQCKQNPKAEACDDSHGKLLMKYVQRFPPVFKHSDICELLKSERIILGELKKGEPDPEFVFFDEHAEECQQS